MCEREAHRSAIRVRVTIERKIRGRTFYIFWRGWRLLRRRRVRLPLGPAARQMTNQIKHAVQVAIQRPSAACAHSSSFLCSVAENAFALSLATSIVPTTRESRGSRIGTTISESVLPNAVKYRGSLRTCPTTTADFSRIAELVRPFLTGNGGYAGAPGLLEAMIETSSELTS
jgi:hypothetical protein